MDEDIPSQRDKFTKFESYCLKIKEFDPDTSDFLKFDVIDDGIQKFNNCSFLCLSGSGEKTFFRIRESYFECNN